MDLSAVAGADYARTSGTLGLERRGCHTEIGRGSGLGGSSGREFAVVLESAVGAGFAPIIQTTVSVAPTPPATGARRSLRLEPRTRVIGFSAPMYSASTADGIAVVVLTRTGGSSGNVEATFKTMDLTAVAGTDYDSTSGTLSWNDGDVTPRSVMVPISTAIPGGQFTVVLTSAVGAGFASIIQTTVSIVPTPPATGASTSGQFGIAVNGNKMVSTRDGSVVQLIGTSASGLVIHQDASAWPAYANSTLAFWQSLVNYQGSGINVVRITAEFGVLAGICVRTVIIGLQSTVQHVVSMATQAGLYVILDLHWDAPNNSSGVGICPTGQGGFASNAHAPAFWTSVADTFKGNPAVIFELFNEPFGGNSNTSNQEWVATGGGNYTVGSDGTYLANGGNYSTFLAQNNVGGGGMITTSETWAVAGEKQLITAIRGTGATNVILASSLGWAGDIFTWLSAYNTNGNPDPLHQLAASWHVYGYALGTAGRSRYWRRATPS